MTRRAKNAQAQNAQAASAQTDVQTLEAIAATVAELMTRYSFDLGSYALTDWVEQWLAQYPCLWLRSAVIEALYQGRYKAISVWQLLDLWQRRGQPLHHFNREFERMVSGRSFQLLFPAEPAYSSPSTGLIAIPQSRAAIPASVSASVAPDQPNRSALSRQANPGLIVPAQRFQASAPPEAEPVGAAAPSPVIQPFKPAPQQLSLPDRRQLIQPRSAVSAPVQRFIPIFDRSEFHTKLKSMAAALVRANAHAMTDAIATVPPLQLTNEKQAAEDQGACDPATPGAALPTSEAQAEQN
jgi:predicted lipoprotein with Yx(FWY)xxD motif